MASTQQLKSRIGSVKNTKQITKAMELVAASKMRRAQDNAARSRDYRDMANQILTRIRELTDVSKHVLFEQRPLKTRLHIVISSDRGLAGAYNNNVFRQFAAELQEDKKNNVASQAIVVGKQAAQFAGKLSDCEVIAVFTDFPDRPTPNDIRPLLNTIVDLFVGLPAAPDKDVWSEAQELTDVDEGHQGHSQPKVDAVDIIYTNFLSSVRQDVTSQRLLPAAFQEVEITNDLELAVFEPSVERVLEGTALRLIESQLSQAFLESQASEHSMRMMAMKNATDNANELIDDLTLEFNTARQAAITQEIAEITGGAEAIK